MLGWVRTEGPLKWRALGAMVTTSICVLADAACACVSAFGVSAFELLRARAPMVDDCQHVADVYHAVTRGWSGWGYIRGARGGGGRAQSPGVDHRQQIAHIDDMIAVQIAQTGGRFAFIGN